MIETEIQQLACYLFSGTKFSRITPFEIGLPQLPTAKMQSLIVQLYFIACSIDENKVELVAYFRQLYFNNLYTKQTSLWRKRLYRTWNSIFLYFDVFCLSPKYSITLNNFKAFTFNIYLSSSTPMVAKRIFGLTAIVMYANHLA